MAENSLKNLKKGMETGELSHAYIFSGGGKDRRSEVINRFVKAVLCDRMRGVACGECLSCKRIDHGNHPDVIQIKRDGLSIKVDQIEGLQMQLRNKPYGERTVAVIEDADFMVPQSQNKLLKTLEEPNSGTIIILDVENVDNLYKTIQSRCVTILLKSGTPVQNEMSDVALNVLQKVADKKGSYEILEDLVFENRDDALLILDAMEAILRDSLVSRFVGIKQWIGKTLPLDEYQVERMLGALIEARNDINYKINPKYTMKCMVLKMIENGGIDDKSSRSAV